MTASKVGYTEGIGLNLATYSFTEDAVTKHVERIAPAAGVMSDFDDSATVTASGLVSDFSASCVGKGRIIVGAKAASVANTDFCTFRLVFKNGTGVVIGTSVLTQSTFTELTSGGSPDYRYGTASVFANDCCASSVEVYVVSIPSGSTVLIYLAAV